MQQQPANDLVYFLTILEAAGKIEIYGSGFSNSIDFFQANDQLNFNATLLLIATIGEQIAKISNTTKSKYTNISWQKIKDTRNRIVHDYTGIDFDITYDIVTKEIPVLKKELEQLVKNEIIAGIFLAEELKVAQSNKLWYQHVDFSALQ